MGAECEGCGCTDSTAMETLHSEIAATGCVRHNGLWNGVEIKHVHGLALDSGGEGTWTSIDKLTDLCFETRKLVVRNVRHVAEGGVRSHLMSYSDGFPVRKKDNINNISNKLYVFPLSKLTTGAENI